MWIFSLIGIVLLVITIWVHKHTYGVTREYGEWVIDINDPAPFPVWLLILMIIIFIIPIVNIAVFIVGAIGYIISYCDDDIRLNYFPKWFKSIIDFLNKPV